MAGEFSKRNEKWGEYYKRILEWTRWGYLGSGNNIWGLKFGYVIICDKNSNVKCQRTFTDESTGISAIYHGFNNSDNCNENMLTTNTEFVVRKNDVSNPDELKQMILELGQSSLNNWKLKIVIDSHFTEEVVTVKH